MIQSRPLFVYFRTLKTTFQQKNCTQASTGFKRESNEQKDGKLTSSPQHHGPNSTLVQQLKQCVLQYRTPARTYVNAERKTEKCPMQERRRYTVIPSVHKAAAFVFPCRRNSSLMLAINYRIKQYEIFCIIQNPSIRNLWRATLFVQHDIFSDDISTWSAL